MFRNAFTRGEIDRIEDLSGVRSMLSEVVDQIIERGKEEGFEQKARETARRMLVEGISVDVISRVTGLTVGEIRSLAESGGNDRR